MDTGCLDCNKKQAETKSKIALCDKCELEYLDWCVANAMDDYKKKCAEIEFRESEMDLEEYIEEGERAGVKREDAVGN